MMRLASNCYANHKAGQVMDALGDKQGGGLLTPSLSAFMQPPDPPWLPPHQLPLTPHRSPASARHVLGVKGFSTYRSSERSPTSSGPTHNQSLGGGQRWIGTSTTLYLVGSPPPPLCSALLLSLANNRGGPRRSEQVKSAAPGSGHNATGGNSFLFRCNSHSVQQHV